MFSELYSFELRYHLKQPLFYILLTIFFFLTFGAVTSDAVTLGGAVGNVHRNAPYVIMFFLGVMSVFGVLTTTAYVASSVHRDVEFKTDSLFFSSPMKKSTYLLGRFFGSLTIASAVYAGVMLAIMIGSKMPWIDKERVGAFELWPYVFSFLLLVLPNLFLFGAIFFCVAALTRSLMATYSSAVGFYVVYGIVSSFTGQVENERLASLFDPFGLAPFELATRYWTVAQKNSQLLSVSDVFLWNRVIWMSVAVVFLAATLLFFKTTSAARAGKKKRKAEPQLPLDRIALTLPHVTQSFGGRASFAQYLHSTKIETLSVIRGIPYLIILFLGCANTLGSAANNPDVIFGTNPWPVTMLMLRAIEGGFTVFAILIAAFYAGDIIWRERAIKLNEVHDATPAPTWTIWASKLTALATAVLITLVCASITTILYQTYKGYHHYEPKLYLAGIGLIVLQVALIGFLAFIAQIVTNNKYVGFAAVMLFFIVSRILPAMHYEHYLYRLFNTPGATYSDMNGYGPFAKPTLAFASYWLLFAAILVVVGHLLWTRGTETAFKIRRRQARARFGKPAAAALTLFLVAFASTGCYIYYNTNILNHYTTADQLEKRSAEYEKTYKKYERLPQPRITSVQADVDIYPEQSAVDIRGTYTLVNKTAAPVRDLHVSTNADLTSTAISIPNATIAQSDKRQGYTIYRLDPPLAPGASMTMAYRIRQQTHGFPNARMQTSIVENGTFFNNQDFFPHLGYVPGNELQDRGKRKKYGLPPIERMAKQNDAWARGNNGLSRESDWIDLDTTVSTSADQIALAPGYLQKDWTSNGRRYFHYKTTSPILGFWAYLSARYQVKRDSWNGIPIEVYYDAKHPYNVDRMIYGVKKSLDYFTANFGPYQHKQVRILEFPRYARFAQSFPNTIPFSESIGFIADLRDKDAIDFVFYVTAHEVAHQWWGHQVAGADVQGSTMLIETMAQYSALMVQEKEYGKDQMRRFLKFELDRYLQGRGGELVAEMPLEFVENQQYIHYRKGSVIMYALRDAIGEANVNRALASFVAKHKFEQPPYTTSADLVREFRAVAPPDKQELITGFFERIELYDNKTTAAQWTKLPNGKYRVTVTVEAKKLRSNGAGDEQPVPVDDWIDLGILGDGGKSKTHDDKVLFLEKRHLTQPTTTFEATVDQLPTRAGIDPFNKLIDRQPEDNTKKPSGS
jgi:ABC-2 type transport system permease protein